MVYVVSDIFDGWFQDVFEVSGCALYVITGKGVSEETKGTVFNILQSQL